MQGFEELDSNNDGMVASSFPSTVSPAHDCCLQVDCGEWVSTFGPDAGFTQSVYNHKIDDEFRQVDTNNDGKVHACPRSVTS